jgi:hypothetical protein
MKQQPMNAIYYGIINLDKLPKIIKFLNWIICFILTVLATVSSYFIHVYSIPSQLLFNYGTLIAWVSPACITAAWLRVTGISWRYILLFILLVPITSFIIEGMISFLGYILMGD